MGSTAKADKKKRHVSSISPAVSTTKKQPLPPLSEEKKLDAAVLQFQNKKLLQKLETQKVEINTLEDGLCLLRDKQYSYEKTLAVVDSSWNELVDHLESDSNCSLENTKNFRGFGCHLAKNDGESAPEDALLSRLLETGATESSSTSALVNSTEYDRKINGGMTETLETILKNIVASFDNLNNLKSALCTASLKPLSSND